MSGISAASSPLVVVMPGGLDASASLSPTPEPYPTDDPYRDRVRESDEIDSEAWAKLLAELLAAAGKTPEQVDLGVNWRTVRRWLASQQGVTARSVRDACRVLGYPPVDALVRVGFLAREEVGMTRDPAPVAPPLAPPLRRIADVLADPRVPEVAKRQMRNGAQAVLDVWIAMYQLKAPREGREQTSDQRQ